MEMNHKLFDECSQKYKLEKQKEKEKLRDRDSAWMKIESKARQNPNVRNLGRKPFLPHELHLVQTLCFESTGIVSTNG